jgi:hypothetical protein
MSAAKKISFKIPLQSEVQAYMKQKKGWPDKFCEYYAEKFWNNYQAQGWKLSNGNPMKDWMACFNNQWQNLKYADDIAVLQKFGGVQPAKVIHLMAPKQQLVFNSEVDKLDALLTTYSHSPTSYSTEKIMKNWPSGAIDRCYKAIKDLRLWCPEITKKELEGKSEKELKVFVIVRTLDWYGCKGWKFSDTLKVRNGK